MALRTRNIRRMACSALAFALTLSLLLVPVNVKKAHAFDWLDPPQPGAAEGWYVIKEGKYQGALPLWESTYEYNLNDAGQVIEEIQNHKADTEVISTSTHYEYDSEGRVSRLSSNDDNYYRNYQYVYDYKDDGTIVTTETWDNENASGETETWTNIRTTFPFPEIGWYMGEWHSEFDSKGRLIHRWTDSGSDWTCSYEDDDQGRTAKGTIWIDHAGLERLYTYHEDGGFTMRETSRTGYEEFTYNKDNRLTQYVNNYGDGPVTFDYTYDEAGNNTLIDGGGVRWVFEYIQLPEPDVPDTSFVDVPENAFYAEAVKWAVENGITNGLDNTHFGPEASCTRGQIVTFLWRSAGEPEPTITENPFEDVTEKAFYYKAVLWAAEKNITAGTSSTTFSPAAKVTREQTVTFLWRKNGAKKEGSDNPFTDVPQKAYYTDAVLWAVKNGVTNGIDKQTFGTGRECTRGQIVTFLFRAPKEQ